MKKTITLAIVALIMASCKKDVTCKCRTRFTDYSETDTTVSVRFRDIVIPNTTKKKAEKGDCKDFTTDDFYYTYAVDSNGVGIAINKHTVITKTTCQILM